MAAEFLVAPPAVTERPAAGPAEPRRAPRAYSEEEARIKERLRGLGYME